MASARVPSLSLSINAISWCQIFHLVSGKEEDRVGDVGPASKQRRVLAHAHECVTESNIEVLRYFRTQRTSTFRAIKSYHDKQSSSSHYHGPTRGRERNDIIKNCIGIQAASPLERRPPPYTHLPRHPHRPRGQAVHLGGSPGPRPNHGLSHPGLNLWV